MSDIIESNKKLGVFYMSRGRKKKVNLTLEENLANVNAQIKETEE